MNTMYLALEGNVSICCVNKHGECYFYVEHDYVEDLLDIIYNYIISCNITKVITVVQGNWSVKPYGESYISGATHISNAQFFGCVSQLDINKLAHLFKAANISNYEFIDKFAIYKGIINSENRSCCLVDRSFSSIILLIAVPNASQVYCIKEIFYILPSSLGKYIAMLRRKYNLSASAFIDVRNYALCDSNEFDKFNEEDAVKIGQMSKAEELAGHEFKLDKTRIAFSSKFNSYNVEDTNNDTLNEEAVEVSTNKDSTNSSNIQKAKLKIKRKPTSVLLTALIILCMLSIIGVALINKIIGNDINGLLNKLKAVQVELSDKEAMLNVCELCTTTENSISVNDIYDILNITDLGGIELAYADIRTDGCAATYYVKGDQYTEVLVDEISRSFTVESVTELSNKKQNGITYYQKSIKIDY